MPAKALCFLSSQQVSPCFVTAALRQCLCVCFTGLAESVQLQSFSSQLQLQARQVQVLLLAAAGAEGHCFCGWRDGIKHARNPNMHRSLHVLYHVAVLQY